MNANNIPAGWREVLERAKSGLGAGGRNYCDQEFIDYGVALIDHIHDEIEAIASAPSTADFVAHETPSDNGACVQPASGEVAEAGQVEANLEGLADLWDQSALDTASTASWNEYQKGLAEGLRQASRDLRSSLAATPASPQAPAPQAALTHEQIATFGLGLEYVHDVLRWAACGYVHTPERIAQLHTSYRIVDGIINATPSPAPSAAPHQGADALREALADALEFIEHYSHAWNGVSAKHPNTIATKARAALAQHQATQQGEQHE